jgi:hypothetical protein
MATPIQVNASTQAERDVEIYLEKLDGTPQTDLTGLTITYMKPGGTDTTKTLTSDGNGRYRMQLTSGDVNTTGVGWVDVTGTTIIPYHDAVKILPAPYSVSLANGAIALATFTSGAIDSTVLAANAIGASQIASNAITAAKFATGAITSTVLDSTAANKVRDAVLAGVVNGTRTVKGILARVNAFVMGRATGLDGAVATFYLEDGATPAMQFTQDTDAGTRSAASSANGD